MAELYKDYRPTSFDEIVGQEEAVSSLETLLKRDKENIPHAMLFSGPRGTGKTTLARIVAAELGADGPDFIEVDSAQFRGIDSIREMRRNMQLAPRGGECMVWLLDECHELTKTAQDALLKALEDAPAHVYIMLATTDPQMLLGTVRSRCTIFETQEMSTDELEGLIIEIADAEEKKVPKDVVRQIAADSCGAARDALVILDSVIDLPQKKMKAAAARSAEQQNESIELCRAIMKGAKWDAVRKILKGLQKEQPERIRRHVLSYASSVLMGGQNERAYLVLDSFREPFYNTGFPGLVGACYEALNA